jgi:uncharacterized protein involved in exopolysaccharide biosynthesis
VNPTGPKPSAVGPLSDARPPRRDDPGEFIDYRAIAESLSLGFGALWRNRVRATVVFLLFVSVSAALIAILPRSYHTESRILAQRNLVMPALGNPRRAVPIDSDTPTRAVSETILTRDNLVALIKQLDLMDRWEGERAPILKVRARILDKIRKPLTEPQRLEALVGTLEKRLKVTTDEGTVTIAIDWPSAHTAFELVQTAQDNFLRARHETEVSTIDETISILEGHANEVRKTIEETLDQIEKVRSSLALPAAHGQPRRKRSSPDNAALAELRGALDEKRRQISELETQRAQQLGQLNVQLAQEKATYAPAHPIVISTEQSIKDLSVEPAALATLRREESELTEQYIQFKEVQVGNEKPGFFAPLVAAPTQMTAREREKAEEEEDERIGYPKARLKIAGDNYEDLLRRIEGARIELDTAQAAFKYRYRVIRPADVPERPSSPKVPALLAAGVVLGLLSAFFSSLAAERRGNKIQASWQVERALHVPVLVEIGKS